MTGRLGSISRTLQSRIRDFFDSPLDAAATPLEIARAILDELELKVQPVGGGRRTFPFNRIFIRVGPAIVDRPALQATLDGLGGRFGERLAELRCPEPPGLEIRVVFLKRTPADWAPARLFAIECRADSQGPSETREDPPRRTLRVTVVQGAAARKSYTFTQAIVSIGRTAEPTDDRGRVRRNDVVFLDTVDGITETVGRAHARLQYDGKIREYRVFNEGSSNPTFIARGGTTIHIPIRDPRGVRVRSDDELHVGRAVLRLAIEGA